MIPPIVPTDREVQDEIIRYLTDAGSRTSAILDTNQAEKAQRFSRFLARRYYRDRLHRGFRYSRKLLAAADSQLPGIVNSEIVETQHAASLPGMQEADPSAPPTGIASADDIVDSPEFDAFLSRCQLGSLASARGVGDLVLSQLLRMKPPGPWWPELLQYEFAFFIQLATSEIETPSCLAFPRLEKSTMVIEFSWKMPELLASLRSGVAQNDALRGRTVLLFSRTHHGKIYVVELDAAATALLKSANGERSVAEIASHAAIPAAQAQQILASLREIGAVLLPDSE